MSARYRIMIVDDNEDTLVILKAILREEYEIVTARDGVDALEKLETHQPDCFILDVNMPVMDGFDTCVAIRRHPRYTNALVMFLSGVDSTADKQKTFAVGGNFFIPKPFTPDRVKRNLAMSLESAAPPAPKQFTLEQLEALERQPAATTPLPASPAAAPARPGAAPQPPAAEGAPEKVRPRLMIVDDDEDIQFILGTALGGRFEVVTANDGRDAVSRIMDIEPDLLLLDISMPRMNGYELCASLRKTRRFHKLPIVFLSANNTPRDIKHARDVGGNDFVAKPCAASEVEKALDQIMKSPDFYIATKRRKLEQLLDMDHLYAEKKRARLAQDSVNRDFGGLRKFIEENFMKDLKSPRHV